jgi:hypothetical protein
MSAETTPRESTGADPGGTEVGPGERVFTADDLIRFNIQRLQARISELDAAGTRRLWRVELGGAIYWVTAASSAEALGLILFVNEDGDIGADHLELDLDSISVEGVGFAAWIVRDEAELASKWNAKTFWHDGDGKDASMWEAHTKAGRSEVIACSEWP